jgi:hypothetical protein
MIQIFSKDSVLLRFILVNGQKDKKMDQENYGNKMGNGIQVNFPMVQFMELVHILKENHNLAYKKVYLPKDSLKQAYDILHIFKYKIALEMKILKNNQFPNITSLKMETVF